MAKSNFVKAARKDYPEAGIKKGDSYYWWKFNFSKVVHRSKLPPSRSQLTQSEFLSSVYDIEDRLSDLSKNQVLTIEDVQSEIEDIVSELETLRDETQEKLDAMPEQLQDTSSSGELLQSRVENLEGMINDLEAVDFDDKQDEETEAEQVGRKVEELSSISYEGE